jgi:hypothetical protein
MDRQHDGDGMSSPTVRSLKYLRDAGYLCQVVEVWNSFTRTRKDLFGFIDIIAVKEGETLAVQTTTTENMSARVRKIADTETTPLVRKADWKIHVHGWSKNKSNRWELKIIDVS